MKLLKLNHVLSKFSYKMKGIGLDYIRKDLRAKYIPKLLCVLAGMGRENV